MSTEVREVAGVKVRRADGTDWVVRINEHDDRYIHLVAIAHDTYFTPNEARCFARQLNRLARRIDVRTGETK